MDRFGLRKLRVYQVAMQMSVDVSRLMREIPPDHRDLIWQIRRAARSVVLNIAEGAGEYAPMEKARIYRIARRSAWETVAALDCAIEEGFLEVERLDLLFEQLDHVIAMLTRMGLQAESRALSAGRRGVAKAVKSDHGSAGRRRNLPRSSDPRRRPASGEAIDPRASPDPGKRSKRDRPPT